MTLPSPSPTGLAARRAALELVTAALSRRAALDEPEARRGFEGLDARDRGFANALALAALRHLGPIDRALDTRLKKPPPEAVRNVLRLGLAQAFVLQAPAHAATASSVDLVAGLKGGMAFKGLVNAVMRGLLREPPDLEDPDALAPPWLYERWRSAFGPEAARAMAALIAEEPPTDLSPRAAPTDPPGALEAEPLEGGTWRTRLRGDVAQWPGFAEGQWWVQDASAAVPARLFHLQLGQSALDLCAAPGGKTLQLAAAGARVTALDRSAVRLQRLTENLQRMSLAAEVVAADALTWSDPRIFDAVLLDAPCSATGTFRRNPDVLWAVRPGDVAALAAGQAQLLDAAAARVAPGGRLIYCVCALEPEEGEAQVRPFLTRHPGFQADPMTEGEGGAPAASLRADGTLRILPHHRPGGTDGFFIARFRRDP